MGACSVHDEALAGRVAGVFATDGRRNRRMGWAAVTAVGASFAALPALVGLTPPGA